jgi:RNA-binding protein Tab2/Atab2
MSFVSAADVWELDFYSRPILDQDQKKLWELLICDRQHQFEFVKYCTGAEANARWLQQAMQEAIHAWQQHYDLPSTAQPEKVRFFRRQMNSIITRACSELQLQALPSRRTFALYQWLRQRAEAVYPEHPGYQPLAAPPTDFAPEAPQPLPDALRGDRWVFASLTAADLAAANDWEIKFGEVFAPNEMGLDLAPSAPIPGLIIYSARAIPLAGWMSGLELAAVDLVEAQPSPQLILETGASDRWVLLNLRQPNLLAEAKNFISDKQKSAQVHFLAIQADAKSESFAGFWILQAAELA